MELPGETILEVQQLSKLYARRDAALRRRLGAIARSALFGGKPPEISDLVQHEFWALREVSFDLKRGNALGVIGLNGSGKTTLLRILAGQILPDKGEVRVRGTSASMIDLAAGFQNTATGFRNIFLRAAALGFTHNQTRKMLDEIIAFSELGDALEAPIGTYSSGMKMRLAFSVIAMVQPDILFIDEVLSVGDFRFRQKCLARVREMRDRSAFVLVSHAMSDISRFCDRVIVLHKGRVALEAPPKEAIEYYESLTGETPTADTSRHLVRAMGPTLTNESALTEIENFWCDENGQKVETREFSQRLFFKIAFRSLIDSRNLAIGIPVWNVNAHYTTGLSTEITSDRFKVRAGEKVAFLLEVDGGVINPGTIKSMVSILDGTEFLSRQPNPDLVIHKAKHPTWGVVTVPHRWRKLPSSSPPSLRAGTIELP